MMTRVLTLVPLLFTIACNQEDYYEKEFLENPFQPNTPGWVDPGNGSGGGTGTGGTGGGLVTGGSDGGGASGGTDGGLVTGGSDGGGESGGTGGTGGSEGGEESGGTGGTGGSEGGEESGGTGGTGGSEGGGESGGTGGTGGSEGGGEDISGTAFSEKFFQTEVNTKKLDILWVIDDSGSMADEQAALGTNFNAFINDFITSDVDFQMAITTTDATYNKRGAVVSGSFEKLTSAKAKENEATFLNDFRELVQVGTRGSGYEKGLEGSKGFMERYASSYLRSDAYLAVVFMSDEEDQSSGSVSSYVNFLKSHKVDPGLVKIYSIVNTDTRYQQGLTVGFERYQTATNLTGGKLADIKGNFYQILNDMGGNLLSLLDSFALAHAPLEGTLKVFVNNAQVNNFTYDAGSRSIKFDANDLPPVGAEIKVEYKY